MNVSWTLVGNVVYAACQWAMLTVMARFGSPTMVGQYALALAITTPVMMLADLQLRGIQATDAKRQYPFASYLVLRLFTTLLAILAVLLLIYLIDYRGEMAWLILLITLGKGFDSVSNIMFGLFQQRERLDWVASSMMLNGALSVAALAIGIGVTGSILWGVLGSSVVSALILLFHNIPRSRDVLQTDLLSENLRWFAGWTFRSTGKLVVLAIPMGIVLMLGSLSTNIPRYFLENFASTYELGVYSAIAALLVAGNTVISALGQAASPRLAQYYAAKNFTSFRRLLAQMLAIGALLGALAVMVAVFGGEAILRILYGSEYAASNDILVLISLAGVVTYVGTFMGVAATSMRQFRIQVPIHLLKISVTLIAGFVLIREFGMVGAAWTLIIATAVSALTFSSVVWFHLRDAHPKTEASDIGI